MDTIRLLGSSSASLAEFLPTYRSRQHRLGASCSPGSLSSLTQWSRSTCGVKLGSGLI